jgi:hypothetical protein
MQPESGRRVNLKSDLSLLALFLLAALISASCSARRPIAATGPSFRLESVGGESILFSPSIPASHPNDSQVNITMNLPLQDASVSKNCLAEEGPFRVEPAREHPDSVQITLPSAKRWLGDVNRLVGPDGDAVEALYVVLTKLDQLQQDGCFRGAGPAIRDFMVQSLPMKPPESLFSYYGYRPDRSSLDLKPGLRLKIERAYFRAAMPPGEAPSTQNFAGLSTVNFDVESGDDGKIHFRQIGGVQFTPESLKGQVQDESRELELIGIVPEFHYRLIFYTLLVSKEQKLSAAIVGAGSPSQLDEFDHELRLRPLGGCRNFAATHGVACVEFSGLVTVTCQITVELNGKSKLIDWGTRVKDLITKNSLGTLSIQRKFMNSYREVRFDPGDLSVLSLALVGGDRLRWSKGASSGR